MNKYKHGPCSQELMGTGKTVTESHTNAMLLPHDRCYEDRGLE